MTKSFKLWIINHISTNLVQNQNLKSENSSTGGYMNNKLEEIEKSANICKKCSLWKNRKNIVFSKGNTNAKIMLIGEAPGLKENECGLPFVGKSGQLLDNLLIEVGFNPKQDIYFCNTVKCRPVKNNKDRKPTNKELQACNEYLQKQIEIINPQIIILCGNTAVKTFGIKESMKQIHGKFILQNGVKLYPIYHPRASVSNKTKLEDLKKIKESLG